MPGLNQLEQFTQKLLSLGNETSVRQQTGELRAQIPLPPNAAADDDSDDFMFGLDNVGEPPSLDVEDDFLGIPGLQVSADDAAVPDDFDAAAFINEAENTDTADQDFAVPPPADAAPPDDLDALLAGLADDIEIPATSAPSADAAATPDIPDIPDAGEAGEFDGFPDFPDFPATTLADSSNTASLGAESAADFSLPEDLSAAEAQAGGTDILPEIPAGENEGGTEFEASAFGADVPGAAGQEEADSGAAADNAFDLPADFDLLKELDLPDGAAFSGLGDAADAVSAEPEETAAADFSADVPPAVDAISVDENLSADLANVEDLFGGSLSDIESPEEISEDLSSELSPPEDTELSGFESDFSNLPDFPSADESGAVPEIAADFDDFPSIDSLPTLDDLQPEKPSAASDEFGDFDASFPGDAAGDDFLAAGADGMPAAGTDDFGTGEEHPADDMFSGLPGEFDLPPLAAPTGDERNVASEDAAFDFDTNFFPEGEDKKSGKTPSIPKPEEKLPNEFTEEEYRRFLHILNGYPLNLRVAIEELIVENQFLNGDAVADLIRRVIKKTGARQLASHVGKLLDKPVQIPRDFEKRSAAQYDLYKQSVEYQIKNRVLPAVFLTFSAVVIVILLAFLGEKFVYRPIHAEILYNQGYKLLQGGSYPQAGQKFDLAVDKLPVKNWFLKYAAAYREHKQYERARQVYERGLRVFENDKKIGLTYAEMELHDLANYARAEEIVKRHVLDFHINDKDGLLLLGDIYLDWGTEKDPEKLEDARRQYATLMELYGQSDLYLSRLMRYFIRIDNLREVLPLKDYFLPKKKALGAADLVELSGYLLEKQYGPLSPADEYLRAYIEDVRTLLERAMQADSSNPEAHYNFGKYFLNIGNRDVAKKQLAGALAAFEATSLPRTRALISKNIDTYRLLGNLYSAEEEYLMAEELYSLGIQMFEKERNVSSLAADQLYGKLYADMGDLNYFISLDLERAYADYQNAIVFQYDTPSIRYKIGYIQYEKQKYPEALGSFIKAASEKPGDRNVLYALGNVLTLRSDNFAAIAYYEMLLDQLDAERVRQGVLFPQVSPEQGELVSLYMYAANNAGVNQYRLARQTGDSARNARAMVYFADSVRAWDALTRNQITMTRLDGQNLAAQNLKYVTFAMPNFQPEIYMDINRTLYGDPFLKQSSIKK